MTPAEVADAYPGCRYAVFYCELLMERPSGDTQESGWDVVRKESATLSMEQICDGIRSFIKMTHELFTRNGIIVFVEGNVRMSEFMGEVTKQTRHPSFQNYVAAKLGHV